MKTSEVILKFLNISSLEKCNLVYVLVMNHSQISRMKHRKEHILYILVVVRNMLEAFGNQEN